MSFIADTQTKLDTAARKIERINPSAAKRLFRLSAAVGRAPNSMYDAWSANDIHQMVGAQAITEQMRAKDIPGQGLRFLEWVRNLLIFLPLVLTWYGISNAVSSYATFVNVVTSSPTADKTQLQLPFLYLWQQRFGGYLPDWLTLSRLAFYDFLLLFLLVLLTAIVNVRTHLRTSRKEQEAELLQEELTDALSDAALCLTRPRAAGGGVGGVDISPQLQQLQEEIEKDRLSREQTMQNARALIDPIAPLLQNMINEALHIRQSMDNLGQVQQRSMDSLSQVLQNLGGAAQQIVRDQQQMLGIVGQLLTEQKDTSLSVKQLVEDQKTWGQSIEKAVQEFTVIARGLNDLPAAIKLWTSQLEALVNQLGVEHQAQITVTQQTADAAANLRVVFDQVEEVANSLRSISKDFFDVMNMMQGFPDVVNASIGEVARQYNNAAASVAQGGTNLNYAARMLYDVANRLNGGSNGQPQPVNS
ncbi:MAG TPA: hypothetical protein VFQ36_11450 [Ktedonobacteraceae bacterium]|nr:hypothetical protein [Ktedonobacteraceae bacterium]